MPEGDGGTDCMQLSAWVVYNIANISKLASSKLHSGAHKPPMAFPGPSEKPRAQVAVSQTRSRTEAPRMHHCDFDDRRPPAGGLVAGGSGSGRSAEACGLLVAAAHVGALRAAGDMG